MGMFDDIRCEYPLPGNVSLPVADFAYQTKDTPEQYLRQYLITKDGTLMLDKEVKDFTGEINFYHGNVVASGPGVYTRDGEDSFWLQYQSLFKHGKLIHIELVSYRSEPAQKISEAPMKYRGDFDSEEKWKEWWEKEAKAFDKWREEEKAKRAKATR